RSCTVSAVPSHDSEAWEREASLSLRATSPSRPTVIVPARSNSLPASGPSTTAIRAPATDGTLQDPESELGVDPVHHRAQLAALTLDLRVLLLLAHPLEVLLPRAILRDPLARELARLDLAEHILHRLPRRLRDDSLAARVVAVLGGVGDRVAHAADALLVHEVDDQLHLVEALEVGEARVV